MKSPRNSIGTTTNSHHRRNMTFDTQETPRYGDMIKDAVKFGQSNFLSPIRSSKAHSIASSPTKKPVKKFEENEAWKKSNKGRINSITKDLTPSVHDCAHLIKKYPVKREALEITGPDHL